MVGESGRVFINQFRVADLTCLFFNLLTGWESLHLDSLTWIQMVGGLNSARIRLAARQIAQIQMSEICLHGVVISLEIEPAVSNEGPGRVFIRIRMTESA